MSVEGRCFHNALVTATLEAHEGVCWSRARESGDSFRLRRRPRALPRPAYVIVYLSDHPWTDACEVQVESGSLYVDNIFLELNIANLVHASDNLYYPSTIGLRTSFHALQQCPSSAGPSAQPQPTLSRSSRSSQLPTHLFRGIA